MVTIYHYPRCGKSRAGVQLLEERDIEFKTVPYFKEPFTVDSLSELISKLDMKPIELVRTKEKVWKNNFKGKDLSDQAIIEAMVEHPRLIERPIVVNEEKAVVGRPVEEIEKVLP